MYKLILLVLYIFARLSKSATVSLGNIAQLPSNHSLSISNSTFAFNATNNGPFNINCFKADRRGSAKFKACENAAALLPSDRQRTDFMNRRYGAGEDTVPLPMNIVSGRIAQTFWADANLTVPTLDDASCLIVLSLRASEREGRTDYYILREAAYAVLSECVREQGIGGIATDFSKSRYVLLYARL